MSRQRNTIIEPECNQWTHEMMLGDKIYGSRPDSWHHAYLTKSSHLPLILCGFMHCTPGKGGYSSLLKPQRTTPCFQLPSFFSPSLSGPAGDYTFASASYGRRWMLYLVHLENLGLAVRINVSKDGTLLHILTRLRLARPAFQSQWMGIPSSYRWDL